jgi:hypothetical protein
MKGPAGLFVVYALCQGVLRHLPAGDGGASPGQLINRATEMARLIYSRHNRATELINRATCSHVTR